MQTVSQVMTRNVQSIAPGDTIRRAAQLMDDLNVGVLPVCDGERLVGIVTDRDITVRATSAGMAPEDVPVDQVMSADVRWCFEDQPLDEVMRQMADTQIRRVPVVSHDDAHRLVGIVSLGDISAKSDENNLATEKVLETVSYPAAPDRSNQGASTQAGQDQAAAQGDGQGTQQPRSAGNDLPGSSTGTSLAGSDVLADRMNPGVEVSSTDDPSDVVEVRPEDLVNRNAPGSALPNASPGRQG